MSDDASASEGESDALVADHVIVADPSATSSAEVLADRIRLPLAVADRYRTLAPSAIFAGARGTTAGKNPDGFLRRVTSVHTEGDVLVIMTTPATLTDAIVRGAVRASSGGLAIDDHADTDSLAPLTVSPASHEQLRGISVDFANKALFDGEDAIDVNGKQARFVESIRLERAVLTAQPVVDIDMRIEDGHVSRFVAKVQGNVDTSVRATATVTAEGVVDADTLAALRAKKHDVSRVIYQSPRVALPTIAVGGVPISPSVQLTATLKCSLSFGGPLVAHAGVEAKSYVRLGAVYDHGAWAAPIRSDFDIKPSFALEQGGEVQARCAIEQTAELFAFGTSSIAMSVAPYVDFGVKADAPTDAFRYKVTAGALGAMRGESPAFGLRPEDLSREVTEWTSPTVLQGP